jgi:hypothetical protein
MTEAAQKLNELIRLGAVDGIFYAHQWFPGTFRQGSPPIHRIVWDSMDDPDNDFIGLELFRGSAKTTIMRTHISKRVAYAVSRTILLIGPNQGHAVRSVRWSKRQVERNKPWTQAFGLHKGTKWADDEIEIVNEPAECSIYVLGLGISGATRGLNLDDYRPDFIGVDDPCDEENTATPEQREKMNALFFGSLQQGLAPKSEAPHRKMGLFQTGLNKKDLIAQCHKDPTWKTIKLGVFDKHGQSNWEERFPTKELIESKQGFIDRGQIHYWLREMECKIVSAETAAFNTTLLKFYETLPEGMTVFIGIDPARETKLRTKAHKAAIVAIGVMDGTAYLLEYWAEANQNPEAIWQAYVAMAVRWRPLMTAVESVAYQQTLAWYMRQRMVQTNTFFSIKEVTDRRKKPDRIRQAYTERINMGTFKVRKEHGEFIEALAEYTDDVDIDVLDAGAMALDAASPHLRAGMFGTTVTKELARERWGEYKEFEGSCP